MGVEFKEEVRERRQRHADTFPGLPTINSDEQKLARFQFRDCRPRMTVTYETGQNLLSDVGDLHSPVLDQLWPAADNAFRLSP